MLKNLLPILNNVFEVSKLHPNSMWTESIGVVGIEYIDCDGPGEIIKTFFEITFNENGLLSYTIIDKNTEVGTKYVKVNQHDTALPFELISYIKNYRMTFYG